MKLTEHLNLLQQFHPSKNVRAPADYTSGEKKTKIWWQCSIAKDHVWQARFADRLQVFKRRGRQFYDDGGTVGCPFCAPNAKPSSTNNLRKNRPEIAKEWDYEKNDKLTPDNITTNSAKNVYWICPKGHSYRSSVHDRTREDRPHSCPECSTKNSSPEFRIIAELETIVDEVQHRAKIDHYEADIFLPTLNLAIEYDGEYYHRSEKVDRLKNDFFHSKGINLIRVREGSLCKIDRFDISMGSKILKKEVVNDIVSILATLRPSHISQETVAEYISNSDFINKKRFYDLLSSIKSASNENALLNKFPILGERWDYDRNGNLEPFSVSCGDAQLEVFFVCEKHGPYSRTPYSISRLVNPEQSLGCKKCSGRAPSADRNLAILYPKISEEFAYDLNGELSPEKLTPGSSRNIWWRCKKGHEFQRTIKNRTNKGDNDKCPHCKSHPKARN